jgi:hypothetical protein
MFMTTADYAPSALQKATTSLPRVLTLNGDQIVSVMVEHGLGLRPSPNNAERLDIDLGTVPASNEEWKQEFLDFTKSHKLTKSYKRVMLCFC